MHGPARSTTVGDCTASTRVCTAGSWPTSCPGAVFPGTEVCGGGDEDCDGTTDESGASDAGTFYLDSDRDGYGDPARPMRVCDTRVGGLSEPHVPNDRDCDDGDDGISPTAVESCDGVDENCNSMIDDVAGGCDCRNGETRACGPPEAGTGDCRDGSQTCTGGAWGSCVGAIVPRPETCGGGDEDCDGTTDEPGATGEALFYRDSDGGGYGDIGTTMRTCAAPSGYVSDNTDCIDADANAHPGQTTFFAEPACVTGGPIWGPDLGLTEQWYCTGSPAVAADWDYDCDDRVNVGPVHGTTCGFGCGAGGTSGIFAHPLWLIDYRNCGIDTNNWRTCEFIGSTCSGYSFTDTARCR